MGRPVSTNNKRKLAAAAHKGKQPAARPKKAGAPAAGKKRGRRRAQDGDVYEADDAPDVFEQNRQRYDVSPGSGRTAAGQSRRLGGSGASARGTPRRS